MMVLLAILACVLAGVSAGSALRFRSTVRRLEKRVDQLTRVVVGESAESAGLLLTSGSNTRTNLDEVRAAMLGVRIFEREDLFRELRHLWCDASLTEMQSIFETMREFERADATTFFLKNQAK